ncbi:exo-1,3-beta-glucanase [Blyttiomyces sp. JEL0837]|nr:exo-1,3-beta-glucanase [Blyttiomyces sp. JEL0837]
MFKNQQLRQWACSGTPKQKWIAHTGNDAVDPVSQCKSDQNECGILLYSDDFDSLSVCIVSPTGAYQDVLYDPCDTTSKFIFSMHNDGDGSHYGALQQLWWDYRQSKLYGSCQTDVMRLGNAPRARSYGGSNDPKIQGVNLGGWLVLEPWITPALLNHSGVTDHYSFCANAPNVNQLMQDHVNMFITQNDIKTFAGYGINHLRVPVGYWDLGLGLMPDENAYDNCNVISYQQFKISSARISKWSRPYGTIGKTNFWTPNNVKRGVMSVGVLADTAVMAECSGVVVGIDFLNYLISTFQHFTEPAINSYDGADHIKLKHFWRRAYDKGRASNLWVILNPYNQDLAGYMNGRFSSGGGFRELFMLENGELKALMHRAIQAC